MRRQPTAHSFQHTTRRTAAHTWRRGYPGTMCERPQRPRCHAHSLRSWLGMYIYVRMRPCGALAAIFARARGPATRDARYRAAERVNVCAGPSSQNNSIALSAECGTALRAPPAPPVDVKVHKAWRVGRCRGRGRASPLGGGAARARAAPPVVCPPGTQDPREP